MRILLINHGFTISGASLLLLGLADYLISKGHVLDVFGLDFEEGPIREAYAGRGLFIKDAADPKNYDVVLGNTIGAAEAIVAIGKATKSIWLLHETEIGLRLLQENPNRISAFSAATAVVFQTVFQRDVIYGPFTRGLDQRKFLVIPPGIEINVPALIPSEDGHMRIVVVGTVDLRKRQGDLVLAVQRLQQPHLECIIIGRFIAMDTEASCVLQAHPNRFRQLGEISHEETQNWLNSADIFALPSVSESFPLSILEAGSLKKPPLLSDLRVYKGIWEHEKNCLLFPPGNIDQLAAQLARLVGNAELRKQLGRAAEITSRQYRAIDFFRRIETLALSLVTPSSSLDVGR